MIRIMVHTENRAAGINANQPKNQALTAVSTPKMSRKYHALSALIQIPPLGSCLLYETVRRRQDASNSLATSFL